MVRGLVTVERVRKAKSAPRSRKTTGWYSGRMPGFMAIPFCRGRWGAAGPGRSEPGPMPGAPGSALFAEEHVQAGDRVVLAQLEPVGVVAAVLAGDVGEAGPRGGPELDDRANFVAGHGLPFLFFLFCLFCGPARPRARTQPR